MAHADQFAEIEVKQIRPYEKNAKVHSAEQITKIAESIKHFGFVSPCLVDHDLNLIAGHGRLEAAKKLKMKTVPCVFVEGLTDAERRAYILADNKLADLGSWDQSLVSTELFDLGDSGIDMSLFGFDHFWEAEGKSNEAYDEFLDKFETPLTTDDCYTPESVYNAVRKWVVERYGLEDAAIIRPFYPGGDYEHEKYPDGCVVIDNPPFSIFSKICNWYVERGIPFLLFAPAMVSIRQNVTYIGVLCEITYENGANVNTAFVTNMMGDIICTTAPDLYESVKKANDDNLKQSKKTVRKLSFPDCVLRATTLHTMSRAGIDFCIKREQGCVVGQTCKGKAGEFGNSILLSDIATAEKLAAEKLAAEKLTLTEKSKAIIAQLNSPY